MADSTTPDTHRHLVQILLDHVDVARQVNGKPMLTCTCGGFVEEWKPGLSSGFSAHRANAVAADLREAGWKDPQQVADQLRMFEEDLAESCPIDHSCDEDEPCGCRCNLHDTPIDECPTFARVEAYIKACVADWEKRLQAMRAERDQAVAHDRQPYPTADAYEAACLALAKHRQIADDATALLLKIDRGREDTQRLRSWFEQPMITDREPSASLAEKLAAAVGHWESREESTDGDR